MRYTLARTTIPRGTLILVCDGGKALLLTNQGDQDLPDIRVTEVIEAAPNPATSDQGTDRPGRLGVGPAGRVAADQTDWHRRAEEAFATQLAALLEARQHTTERPLIIAAAPRMLGDLRRELSAAVAKTVIAEFDRDLVHQPLDAIERVLIGD
ncbi:MAG: host attachment protein [Alphaproteobacteria bacterium]